MFLFTFRRSALDVRFPDPQIAFPPLPSLPQTKLLRWHFPSLDLSFRFPPSLLLLLQLPPTRGRAENVKLAGRQMVIYDVLYVCCYVSSFSAT